MYLHCHDSRARGLTRPSQLLHNFAARQSNKVWALISCLCSTPSQDWPKVGPCLAPSRAHIRQGLAPPCPESSIGSGRLSLFLALLLTPLGVAAACLFTHLEVNTVETNTYNTAARFPEGESRDAPRGGGLPHPAGDALAPQRGAAQPPLDLSLGHISTSGHQVANEAVHVVDYVTFGPYFVTLDYGLMVVNVAADDLAMFSRMERREGTRKVEKLLKTVAKSGMHVEGWPL